MKLLMTTDAIGGVWPFSLALAHALSRYRISVELAVFGHLHADQAEQARHLGITCHPRACKLEWMDDPWEDVQQAGPWLLDLRARIGAELVHLNQFAHAGMDWPVPVLVTAHSCVLSWWNAVRRDDLPQQWDRYRREVSWGLRSADVVVAPSAAMRHALHRLHGWVPHVQVVHNGLSPRDYQPAAKQPFIFCAGRLWDDAKNIAAVQAVAPRLAWPVCLAGDSSRTASGNDVNAECSRQAAPKADPDTAGDRGYRPARHLGRLSTRDIRRWMARASLYILPARYEPFGLSALEAGLSGCALVLGDIDSLREVWADDALFVPPDDHEALIETVQHLIDNPVMRRHYARRARRRALHYTDRRMARHYANAYRRLVQEHRPLLPRRGSRQARMPTGQPNAPGRIAPMPRLT